MAFTFKHDWSYGAIRKNITNLSEKQIRTEAYAAEKKGFSGHLVVNNAVTKEVSLISTKSQGFLLSHAVRQRLSDSIEGFDPYNFVYIEKKQSDVFVCVYIAGDVHVDSALLEGNYEFEIATALIKSILVDGAFRIVISGDDSDWLCEELDIHKDELSPRLTTISCFIEDLEPSEETHKMKAANEIKLKPKVKYTPYIFIGLGLVVLLLFSFVFSEKEDDKPVIVKNPYEKYIDILTNTGISPKTRLSYLYNDTSAFKELSGWEVKSIDLQEKATLVTLTNTGGSFSELESFGYKRQYSIAKVNRDYVATSRISHTPIFKEAILVPGDSTLRFVEDAARAWLPQYEINKVSSPVSNGKWSEIKFNVRLGSDGWTKHDFDTFGTILNGLPIGFESGKLIYDKDKNAYTGDIAFIIYGSV